MIWGWRAGLRVLGGDSLPRILNSRKPSFIDITFACDMRTDPFKQIRCYVDIGIEVELFMVNGPVFHHCRVTHEMLNVLEWLALKTVEQHDATPWVKGQTYQVIQEIVRTGGILIHNSRMSSIDEYLRLTMILCHCLGMWPDHCESTSFLKRSFSAFRKLASLFGIGNIVVPQILAIVEGHGDLAVFTRVGCVLLTCSLALYKMIYLILNGPELARVYFTVRDFWETSKIPEERKNTYEVFARRAKIFTLVFFFSVIGTGASAIVEWIEISYSDDHGANSPRRLPFEAAYRFDVESSPNYEITFAGQIASAICCLWAVVGLDSFMITLALHISGQFALVRFWYQDMGRKVVENQFFNEDIEKCLMHHQRIIKLANDLEDLLSPVIFVQLVSSSAEICLCGYAVTTGTGNRMDMFRFTNFLITMTVQLCAWCTVGEILMRESEAVGNAAFHGSGWYRFPVHRRRDFSLVILRSQRPCCLTAAKFQTINAEKLNQVFSSAISYFTLLRQMS